MKPILTKKSRYHQGHFTPMYPLKYIGDPTKIIYRSNWEKVFLNYLDKNPNVLRYGSEEVIIPYVSPLDHKVHRYFVDFAVEVLSSDNKIKRYLIEIKPYNQTIPPSTKKINESYKSQLETFLINKAKWNAALQYCKERNLEFKVITEKELFKNDIYKKKRK